MLKSFKRLHSQTKSSWKSALLEQRTLLAGDVAALVANAATSDTVAVDTTSESEVLSDTVELILMNADVDAAESLLPTKARHADLVMLDAAKPGLEQVTEILAKYRNVNAIHFVTHGRPGAIKLGDQWVDTTVLQNSHPKLQRWKLSLTQDAEVLVYGCNTGQGKRGEQFVTTLGSLLDRDVCASIDRTGSSLKGADWELEVAVGEIQTPVAFDPLSLAAYQHSLDITIYAAGQTNDEQMQLLVDGAVVSTWDKVGGNALTGNFVAYNFAVANDVTADRIRVAFTNDVYQPDQGYDRNLRIDRIELNGTTIQAESPQVYSTGTWRTEDQITPGFRQSEFLHANGYMQFATSSPGNKELTIFARGNDGRENMQLLVDGNVVQTWNSIGNVQREFRYTATSDLRADQIRVAFTNDRWEPSAGIDYNLIVDRIRIGATDYQTESPLVYSTGTWVPNQGIVPGFRQQEVLHTNGYFQYASTSTTPGVISLATSVIQIDETAPQVNVVIRRTQGTDGIITVDYRTIDQTAIAGKDYVAVSGTATLANGVNQIAIPITILNDGLSEGDESFGFAIDDVQGGASLLAPRTATVTIADDETARPGDGLTGEYFDNIDFTNRLLVRTDSTVNFNWGNNSPATQINADTFSVRWTGKIKPQFTETYTFTTTADDGVRFYVDGKLIIDNWVDQPATSKTGTISLEAGRLYDIKLEYYERTGLASASLAWSSASQPLQMIPQSRMYSVPALPVPQDQLRTETLVSSLSLPTAIDFSPDGQRMYIAQQNGVVRVRVNGVLQNNPFIDISAQVNGTRDRGLLDIAVHPDFINKPYLYLLFTYDPPEVYQNVNDALAGPDRNGNRAARLIRVTADAATNYTTVVSGSEVVLLGTNSTWNNFNAFVNSTVDFNQPSGGIGPDGRPIRDFIATDSESHTIGSVEFDKDGSLFVSTGDASSYNRMDPRAVRVQNIDDLAGKILRIDPITGKGLSNNPFFNGDADANRSKVYQYGLRNPFRITVNPNNGQLYVGDVGWTQWEEINAAPAGANFGWPYYEGGANGNIQATDYSSLASAQAFYASGQIATPPIVALNHGTSGINAVIAGDFVPNSYYPEAFRNTLLFNDLGQGIVRAIQFGANGEVQSVIPFTTGASAVVQIVAGPDGRLYYVDLDDGLVGRWTVA